MHAYVDGKCVLCGCSREASERLGLPCNPSGAAGAVEAPGGTGATRPEDSAPSGPVPRQPSFELSLPEAIKNNLWVLLLVALVVAAVLGLLPTEFAVEIFASLYLVVFALAITPFDGAINKKNDRPLLRAGIGGGLLAVPVLIFDAWRGSVVPAFVGAVFLFGAAVGWVGWRFLKYL